MDQLQTGDGFNWSMYYSSTIGDYRAVFIAAHLSSKQCLPERGRLLQFSKAWQVVSK